jgi:hypothetical protein
MLVRAREQPAGGIVAEVVAVPDHHQIAEVVVPCERAVARERHEVEQERQGHDQSADDGEHDPSRAREQLGVIVLLFLCRHGRMIPQCSARGD